VIVSTLVVVDLLLLDEPCLEEPLDRSVGRRALPVDAPADIVDRQGLLALDEDFEYLAVDRFQVVETLQQPITAYPGGASPACLSLF
jgi:hypothetical protein